MRYAAMRPFDVANGPGIRSTLFVSGCTHRCKGCFNTAYQDFQYGSLWDEASETLFMSYLNNPNVHGVTFLGGEPLDQTADDALEKLLQRIKKETTHDIWLYSGYTYEHIIKDEKKYNLIRYCDVLVDGPFNEALKDLKLRFRGSRNQRLIDLNETFKQNTIVLYDDCMR